MRFEPLDPGAPFDVRLAPDEEVVLDGSGSFDPEGEEVDFSWRQVSGPAVKLADADTPWPRFVPRAPGRYEFELVVSAPPPGGAAALSGEPSRLVVNVLPPNRPPVVEIDTDLRAEPGQWAALDGGRVTDPDGDAVDFEWRQVAGGPVGMRPAHGRARHVLVRAAEAGKYEFELIARDAFGAVSRARLRLVVAPNDRPPVAIARLAERDHALGRHHPVRLTDWPHPAGGVNSRPEAAARVRTRKVDRTVEVTLDATASRDADADDLAFLWKQTGGPHVRTLYPDADKGLALVSFDAPREGLYSFWLVVSDGVLESEPVEVEVAVGSGREAPVAAADDTLAATAPAGMDGAATGLRACAGEDVFAEVGTEVRLSGSAEFTLPGRGEPPRPLYSWRQVSGPRVGSFRVPSMAESARPRFVPEEPGVCVFSLTVSEEGVRWSAPDLVVVTVLAANRDPWVIAPERVTARAGYLVRIAASCGDPDGDKVEVVWRAVSGGKEGLWLDSTGPVAIVRAPDEGDGVIECVVRDARGGAARARVRVEARPGGRPPVASVTTPAEVRPGEAVVLDGTGSFDPEGETLEYRWSVRGGHIAKLERDDRPRARFRPSAPGRYEFGLVVGAGGRASSPAVARVDVRETTGSGMLEVAPVRRRVGVGRPVVLHAPAARGRDMSWRQIEGPRPTAAAELWCPTRGARAVLRPGWPGRHAFRLEAPDGTPLSRTVRFVASTANARPVVSARAEVSGDATVVLDAKGSFDPDGDPLRFRWRRLEGPSLDLDGPAGSASRLRLVGVPPGRYAVRLVVTDGERVARSEVISFTVPAPEGHDSG
jgi:hypothetical protein